MLADFWGGWVYWGFGGVLVLYLFGVLCQSLLTLQFYGLLLVQLFECSLFVLGYLAQEQCLVLMKQFGTFMYVCRTQYLVGNDGYAVNDALCELSPLQRVASCIFEQEVGLEDDEVSLVLLHVLAKLGGIMFACKAVGVVAVGKEKNLDVHSFGKQHVGTSQGCMDAGFVAVVKQGDIICVSMEETYLRFGECSTRVCHYILNATLVHRDDVGISLDHIDTVVFGYLFLCLIDAVEFASLAINVCFGRVDVFL